MLENNKNLRHESFGILKIFKTNGGSKSLFGSNMKHDTTIRVSIYQGEERRNNTNTRYEDIGNSIIDIEMSQMQFASAITNLNNGCGTPVTIRKVGNTKTEDCPFKNKREDLEDKFEKYMKTISDKTFNMDERISEIINSKNSLNKNDKKEILGIILNLKMELMSNIPYIQQNFNEQIEETIIEAKNEMETFLYNKLGELKLGEPNNDLQLLQESFNEVIK